MSPAFFAARGLPRDAPPEESHLHTCDARGGGSLGRAHASVTPPQPQDALLKELRRYRQGENPWELPPWGSLLGMGVFPFVTNKGGLIEPIGTAFCFSRKALCATALHTVTEVLRRHRHGERLLARDQLPPKHHIDDVSPAVLHVYQTAPTSFNWLFGRLRDSVGLLRQIYFSDHWHFRITSLTGLSH